MTTPAIPAHDAERLAEIAGTVRARMQPATAAVFDAYRLGASRAFANLEAALRELGALSLMVTLVPGDACLAAVDVDGLAEAVARPGDSIETALLAAIEAIAEMRAAEALARSNIL